MAFGTREPRWALHQPCPGPLSLAVSPVSCAMAPNLAASPRGTLTWNQQLWWCGRASSLLLLLSSRGQGCQPGPEEQSLLLQLLPPLSQCQKGIAAAGEAAGTRRTPPDFYLLCFSCWGWRQHSPGLLSSCTEQQRGCRAVLAIMDCHPGDPSLPPVPFVGAVVAQRWPVTYSLGDARFFADLFKRLLSRCTM